MSDFWCGWRDTLNRSAFPSPTVCQRRSPGPLPPFPSPVVQLPLCPYHIAAAQDPRVRRALRCLLLSLSGVEHRLSNNVFESVRACALQLVVIIVVLDSFTPFLPRAPAGLRLGASLTRLFRPWEPDHLSELLERILFMWKSLFRKCFFLILNILILLIVTILIDHIRINIR